MSDNARGLIEDMFVQLAGGMSSEKGALWLDRIAPSTLYFSDRPERVVGHIRNEQFVAAWAEGPDSFESLSRVGSLAQGFVGPDTQGFP